MSGKSKEKKPMSLKKKILSVVLKTLVALLAVMVVCITVFAVMFKDTFLNIVKNPAMIPYVFENWGAFSKGLNVSVTDLEAEEKANAEYQAQAFTEANINLSENDIANLSDENLSEEERAAIIYSAMTSGGTETTDVPVNEDVASESEVEGKTDVSAEEKNSETEDEKEEKASDSKKDDKSEGKDKKDEQKPKDESKKETDTSDKHENVADESDSSVKNQEQDESYGDNTYPYAPDTSYSYNEYENTENKQEPLNHVPPSTGNQGNATQTPVNPESSNNKGAATATGNSGEKPKDTSGGKLTEEQYNMRVAELVAKMYSIKADFVSKLASFESSVKAQYKALPADQKTTATKSRIVSENMNYIMGLEAQCDAQVAAVTSELTALMVAQGKPTTLVDQINSAYVNEKEIKKAYYVSLYK